MIRFLANIALAVLILQAGATVAGAQPKSVTLAVQPSADIPQMLLAIDRDLWRAQGLQVKVVIFASGREALEALLGGSADFAVLTDYPAAIAAVRRQKLSIIADMSRYNGNRVIASKKWMTLTSFKDLAGKTIVTTLGTNSEYTTDVMLGEGGVHGQIVNAAPGDVVPALIRGDAQAAVMFPSNYAQAQKLLGSDYQELRTSSYSAHELIVGASTILETRPSEVEAFLRGVMEADKIVAQDQRAAQAVVIKSLKGVMPPEVLAAMWADYDYKLVLKDDLVDLLSKEAKWIVERGFVKASADSASKKVLRSFVESRFLARLSPGSIELAN